MDAGVATEDITPPPGIRLSGFAGRRWQNTGVRDPLRASALYVADGGARALIVALDTIGLSVAEDRRFRRALAEAAEVAPEAVVVACSHTHSGAATQTIRATGGKETAWTAEVLRRTAQAAREARRAALPVAAVRAGAAPCDAAWNRRTRADSPRDPDCRVLVLESRDGGAIATLFHYAMHPVCLGGTNTRCSADWVGAARERIEAASGGPALFLPGCGGDINPQDWDPAVAGARVGDAADAALAAAVSVAPRLAAAAVRAAVPFGALPEDETLRWTEARSREARERSDSTLGGRQVARAEQGWARACRRLRARGTERAIRLPVRIAALALGETTLVALPGEVFAEIGLTIRQARPATWPVAYAAGNPGYLYPDSALVEGGYEVDLAYRLYGERQAAAGTADALVTAGLAAAGRL